jgi:hypothetical protein
MGLIPKASKAKAGSESDPAFVEEERVKGFAVFVAQPTG